VIAELIILLFTCLIGFLMYLRYVQSLEEERKTIRKNLTRPDRGEDIIFETLAKIFIGKQYIGYRNVVVTNKKIILGGSETIVIPISRIGRISLREGTFKSTIIIKAQGNTFFLEEISTDIAKDIFKYLTDKLH